MNIRESNIHVDRLHPAQPAPAPTTVHLPNRNRFHAVDSSSHHTRLEYHFELRAFLAAGQDLHTTRYRVSQLRLALALLACLQLCSAHCHGCMSSGVSRVISIPLADMSAYVAIARHNGTSLASCGQQSKPRANQAKPNQTIVEHGASERERRASDHTRKRKQSRQQVSDGRSRRSRSTSRTCDIGSVCRCIGPDSPQITRLERPPRSPGLENSNARQVMPPSSQSCAGSSTTAERSPKSLAIRWCVCPITERMRPTSSAP